MKERGAEERASLQATRELSCQLLHAIYRRLLWHIFAQHVEIFEQNRTLVSQRRLKDLPAVHGIFNLAKDPGIGHCPASNQNAITACLVKSGEGAFDGGNVATTGNWNTDSLLDLLDQIPVREPAISLFLGSPMQRDVLNTTRLRKPGSLDRVDRVIVKACSDLDSQRNLD